MFVFSSEYMLAKSVLFCVHELFLMQMTRYMACTVSATWLPDPPCAHGLTDQPALHFFPGLTFPLWDETDLPPVGQTFLQAQRRCGMCILPSTSPGLTVGLRCWCRSARFPQTPGRDLCQTRATGLCRLGSSGLLLTNSCSTHLVQLTMVP